jgi:hypothetical protein
MLTTSTRWLLPVKTINGETETATSAAREWLASKHAPTDTSGLSLPCQSIESSLFFGDHSFPFHAFVPVCLTLDMTPASMSMSNQRRFWGIIKQFQAIWRNYRTTGWERGEIFSMFGVDEESDDDYNESDYYDDDEDNVLHDIGLEGQSMAMFL